ADIGLAGLILVPTLNPGQSVTHHEERLAGQPLLNTAMLATLPPSGGMISTNDIATLVVPAAGMTLDKKAAAGFAGYSGCMLGGVDVLSLPEPGPVTWCFRVRNTGNTWLAGITLTDATLGLGESGMDYYGPPPPLAPGAEGVWVVKAYASGSLRNQAAASAIPVSSRGVPVAGVPAVQASDSSDVIVNGQPVP
ncbi:MAG: hypothetical protein U1F77_19540, partial [Kiritimatiellia bacterium]